MLPEYPHFKTIALEDKTLVEQFTKQFLPYNDFDFVSLWAYNLEGKNAFSIYNNNLVIKIHDFITGEFFYSFLGTKDISTTIRTLLEKTAEENLGSQLKLVPEANFQKITDIPKDYIIKEDPDSFDYILSVNETAELNGSKYHDKRNLVKKFNKLYPQVSIVPLDLTTSHIQQAVKQLFFHWEEQKNKKRQDTHIELTAIERLFPLANMMELNGVGVYYKNTLIGFAIFHIVQKDYAILSFEKCDTTYTGIYEFLNQAVAKHLKKLGILFINYEQDLGIPGLKKAKLLWRPVFFLKKYMVEKLPS